MLPPLSRVVSVHLPWPRVHTVCLRLRITLLELELAGGMSVEPGLSQAYTQSLIYKLNGNDCWCRSERLMQLALQQTHLISDRSGIIAIVECSANACCPGCSEVCDMHGLR